MPLCEKPLFQQEFDDVDDRAYHVLIQDGERPVATGRLFTEDGETYLIGRVAVLSAYRGQHLGERVVTALEQQAKACGAKYITLSAQCRAAGFYEKLGYTKTEEYHMDEFCPPCDHAKSILKEQSIPEHIRLRCAFLL